MTNVVRCDDRLRAFGLRGQNHVAVQLLGIGGGQTAAASIGPHLGSSLHGRSGDRQIVESSLESVQPFDAT
jgi:hypothetical protein